MRIRHLPKAKVWMLGLEGDLGTLHPKRPEPY